MPSMQKCDRLGGESLGAASPMGSRVTAGSTGIAWADNDGDGIIVIAGGGGFTARCCGVKRELLFRCLIPNFSKRDSDGAEVEFVDTLCKRFTTFGAS